jgi:hypothetical protein
MFPGIADAIVKFKNSFERLRFREIFVYQFVIAGQGGGIKG